MSKGILHSWGVILTQNKILMQQGIIKSSLMEKEHRRSVLLHLPTVDLPM